MFSKETMFMALCLVATAYQAQAKTLVKTPYGPSIRTFLVYDVGKFDCSGPIMLAELSTTAADPSQVAPNYKCADPTNANTRKKSMPYMRTELQRATKPENYKIAGKFLKNHDYVLSVNYAYPDCSGDVLSVSIFPLNTCAYFGYRKFKFTSCDAVECSQLDLDQCSVSNKYNLTDAQGNLGKLNVCPEGYIGKMIKVTTDANGVIPGLKKYIPTAFQTQLVVTTEYGRKNRSVYERRREVTHFGPIPVKNIYDTAKRTREHLLKVKYANVTDFSQQMSGSIDGRAGFRFRRFSGNGCVAGLENDNFAVRSKNATFVEYKSRTTDWSDQRLVHTVRVDANGNAEWNMTVIAWQFTFSFPGKLCGCYDDPFFTGDSYTIERTERGQRSC